MILLMLLATLADYMTTKYFLEKTKLVEANPILKRVMAIAGLKGLLLTKLLVVLVIAILDILSPMHDVILGLTAMYIAIVMWNLYHIHQENQL